MKKVIMFAAMLGVVGMVQATDTSVVAKNKTRDMKQYGPLTYTGTTGINGTNVDRAVNKLDVMEITDPTASTTWTNPVVRITKLGAWNTRRDKVGDDATRNNVKMASVKLPVGYLEKGGVKWAWNSASAAKILAFRGNTLVLQITFTGGFERIYTYRLNKKVGKTKVIGSTSNILTADFHQAASDGRNIWIEAADNNGPYSRQDQIQLYNTKLNGLYGKRPKPLNAKKNTKVTVLPPGKPVLPTEKVNYSYQDDGTTIKAFK